MGHDLFDLAHYLYCRNKNQRRFVGTTDTRRSFVGISEYEISNDHRMISTSLHKYVSTEAMLE